MRTCSSVCWGTRQRVGLTRSRQESGGAIDDFDGLLFSYNDSFVHDAATLRGGGIDGVYYNAGVSTEGFYTGIHLNGDSFVNDTAVVRLPWIPAARPHTHTRARAWLVLTCTPHQIAGGAIYQFTNPYHSGGSTVYSQGNTFSNDSAVRACSYIYYYSSCQRTFSHP